MIHKLFSHSVSTAKSNKVIITSKKATIWKEVAVSKCLIICLKWQKNHN